MRVRVLRGFVLFCGCLCVWLEWIFGFWFWGVVFVLEMVGFFTFDFALIWCGRLHPEKFWTASVHTFPLPQSLFLKMHSTNKKEKSTNA